MVREAQEGGHLVEKRGQTKHFFVCHVLSIHDEVYNRSSTGKRKVGLHAEGKSKDCMPRLSRVKCTCDSRRERTIQTLARCVLRS